MNINSISPINLKSTQQRKIVPHSEYKYPTLNLMFNEKEKISILENELRQLELEARDVMRTMDVNTHLTGYQKNKCRYKLFDIENSIDVIKNKIYNIKKTRYTKQIEEFLKSAK